MSKLTIKELLTMKGKCQLSEVFVSSADEAAAAEAAGIQMLVTGGGELAKQVRAAAPNAFLTVPASFQAGVSDAEAIRSGLEVLGLGADAVYTGMGIGRVRAMAQEHIPVVGHVGLVPYRSSWYGGMKAVGKTAAEARKVYEETMAYQDAGAIGVEMEIVPNEVAAEISRRVDILIISMGSGSGGDAQYLFSCDVLGTNRGHVPRHAKVYADLAAEYDRIQQLRIAAYKAFKADVDSGAYPGREHLIPIKADELSEFKAGLGRT